MHLSMTSIFLHEVAFQSPHRRSRCLFNEGDEAKPLGVGLLRRHRSVCRKKIQTKRRGVSRERCESVVSCFFGFALDDFRISYHDANFVTPTAGETVLVCVL